VLLAWIGAPKTGIRRLVQLAAAATVLLAGLAEVQDRAAAQTPRDRYAQAVAHMERGEWAPAITLLRDVIAAVPGNARLHNTLGIALSSDGQGDAAAEQFGRALELEPAYTSALKNLAMHEMSRHRPNAARPYFERLLAVSGGDAFAHLGLAEIAFANGEFTDAVTHFEASLGLLTRDPRLVVNFATALVRTGQSARAAVALEELPATAPPDLHFQAGLVLAGIERYAEAAREFERADGSNADPYELGFNLVLARFKSGQHAEAALAGEALLEAGHGSAELYNVLSQAYESAGDTKSAYDALRTATELAPEDESNYVDLIALCLDHENFDLGIEIADIAVGRVPGSHRLHLQRGVALAMKGRFEDAEGAFDRATALAPEASLPGTALGLILMQQDRLPEAVTVLRKRSKRAAGDYMVHWFLAEALHRSGVEPGSEAEAEAVRAVRRSVALNPELFQSRLLLGRMLARRGVFNEAIEHLQKARAIDPTAVAATYQLALVHRSLGDTEQAKELLALVGRQKAEDREQFTKGGLLRIVREGRP